MKRKREENTAGNEGNEGKRRRSSDGDVTRHLQYIRLFGCDVPPSQQCPINLNHRARPDHYSCANYVINAHGSCRTCVGEVCSANLANQGGIKVPPDMEIVLYTKIGQPLLKPCSIGWQQYWKRYPKKATIQQRKKFLSKIIKRTKIRMMKGLSQKLKELIRKEPCGDLENPPGYGVPSFWDTEQEHSRVRPGDTTRWTKDVIDRRGSLDGVGRVLKSGQYSFNVLLGPETKVMRERGNKSRQRGEHGLDLFTSILDVNSCCHYYDNSEDDDDKPDEDDEERSYGYSSHDESLFYKGQYQPSGQRIEKPRVILQIKNLMNINEVLPYIQAYNSRQEIFDPATNEYIPYPRKIKVHLFACLT